MKLQLAFDALELSRALDCIQKVKEYVDIIEVGTPLCLSVGIEGVKQYRTHFPELEVLADMKIMDGGKKEATMAFENGADYVTVLAVTDRATVKQVVEAAKEFGKKVVVDMICATNIKETVEAMEEIGVDVIAVHTGTDQQRMGRTPLEDLKEIKKYVKNCEVAVAGGINSDTVLDYIKLGADIIIVGKGISAAKDPREEARKIKMIMEEVKNGKL